MTNQWRSIRLLLSSDKSGVGYGHWALPLLCCSLLLYFMLSPLLFSLQQETNLFHHRLSCWPCCLLYLQPPLSFSSYEVIESWGETWENNTELRGSSWCCNTTAKVTVLGIYVHSRNGTSEQIHSKRNTSTLEEKWTLACSLATV